MSNAPIGFFDSGVGGISVLKCAEKLMPEENYIYFGDSANAPYGEKSREKVLELTLDAVGRLAKKNIKALVIACNTATSIAVETLRKTYSFPIVSMEPAVKPALEQTSGKVLLLATSVTLQSERVNRLIERYDKDLRVEKIPCPELAKRIEDAVFYDRDIDGYLTELLGKYKNTDATAVVLGCTHYPFVKDKMKKILGDEIGVFDGGMGTVRHLKNVLIEHNLKNNGTEKGTVEFISSKTDKDAVELYNKLLFGGIL